MTDTEAAVLENRKERRNPKSRCLKLTRARENPTETEYTYCSRSRTDRDGL